MLLNLLMFSLQFVYTIILLYFISKSFLIAMQTQSASIARDFLTSGIILTLSLQATMALLKTLYFQSWEQMAFTISLIALRVLIKSSLSFHQQMNQRSR